MKAVHMQYTDHGQLGMVESWDKYGIFVSGGKDC